MKRFKYPFHGLLYLFKKDYHYYAHFIIGLSVIMLSILVKINTIEWMFILSAIFLVLVVEALNTAIEDTVDLITKKTHPLAKNAKDVAALSVLLTSFYAVIIGIIIFLPKLLRLFNLI